MKGGLVSVLEDMTRQAFAENGPLQRAMTERGLIYRPLSAQVEYASRVARTLEGLPTPAGGKVTLLEAETGIGKSQGYLVPLLLHAAMRRVRVLVSTHTLQLQRQLLDEEVPLAVGIVAALTGRTVSAAPRKGLRNFLSPTRIAELREGLQAAGALTPDVEDYLAEMLVFAKDDGDLQAWVETTGPLRHEVREEDVCLLWTADRAEMERYHAHIQAAENADLVIVPHALLMLSAARQHAVLDRLASGERRFDAGIIDEADQLDNAAAAVTDRRVTVPMLERLTEFLAQHDVERHSLTEETARWQQWMNDVYDRRAERSGSDVRQDDDASFIALGDPRQSELRRTAAGFAAGIARRIQRALPDAERRGVPADTRAEFASIASYLEQFASCCSSMGERRAPVLRWSKSRKYPGFSIINLWPGRLAERLWRPTSDGHPYLRALVMTSATLDAPGEGANLFIGFRDNIGLAPENHNDGLSGRFAPRSFGSMRFVLAHPEVPSPSAAGEGRLNPSWLSWATGALRTVQSRGGRTLVLTTSFSDAEAIAQALGTDGGPVLCHGSGTRLATHLPGFLSAENALLLTPGGWEGLNLPGKLRHVVITRLPFPPANDARQAALVDILTMRGYARQKAEGSVFRVSVQAARRKLRQGIGRGLRAPSDSVTLWILDPRFPLPDAIIRDPARGLANRPGNSWSSFLACIPERFRAGLAPVFDRAEILPP